MFKMLLLCGAGLIASVCIVVPGQAQESAIPNFTSTNFGWLVSSGFDFRPIEGRLRPWDRTHTGEAELVCRRTISTISLPKRVRIHAGKVQATPVRGTSNGCPMPRTRI